MDPGSGRGTSCRRDAPPPGRRRATAGPGRRAPDGGRHRPADRERAEDRGDQGLPPAAWFGLEGCEGRRRGTRTATAKDNRLEADHGPAATLQRAAVDGGRRRHVLQRNAGAVEYEYFVVS